MGDLSKTGTTTRTRSYDYAVAGLNLAAARDLSGLDYLLALTRGEFGNRPSMGDTMNMSIPFDLSHGHALIEGTPADYLLNPMGAVHGGWAATLLDSATGVAVHSALPAGVGYTTADLKVNYTRAIRPDTGTLRAEGRVIHVGRQMATAEARLTGVADGKLYAHATATCFLFPIPAGPNA
ncbi:MAG: hypothetical protein CML02_18690 [Pseudooceanicola sp.]|jgi:uncharacterized protein (TIGR00369 family)|nr:hypothetical protein [Pseudooceanicola sp.]